VLTTAPFWGPYATLAAENGMSLATAPWPRAGEPLDTGPGGGAADFDEGSGPGAFVAQRPLSQPHGSSLSSSDRASLLTLLREVAALGPITLLLDFAYLDYTREPEAVAAALGEYAALGAEGNVLVGACLSLSKSMTLYGGRCGALAFPWCEDPALQAALTQSCRGTWSNCAKGASGPAAEAGEGREGSSAAGGGAPPLVRRVGRSGRCAG